MAIEIRNVKGHEGTQVADFTGAHSWRYSVHRGPSGEMHAYVRDERSSITLEPEALQAIVDLVNALDEEATVQPKADPNVSL